MKKYCLTSCAKAKINDTKRATIEIVTILLVIVSLLAGFMLSILIMGIVTQAIYIYINGNLIGLIAPMSLIDTGLITFLLLSFGGVAIFIMGMLSYWMYRGTKSVVTNRIVGDDFYKTRCKIFEECE